MTAKTALKTCEAYTPEVFEQLGQKGNVIRVMQSTGESVAMIFDRFEAGWICGETLSDDTTGPREKKVFSSFVQSIKVESLGSEDRIENLVGQIKNLYKKCDSNQKKVDDIIDRVVRKYWYMNFTPLHREVLMKIQDATGSAFGSP